MHEVGIVESALEVIRREAHAHAATHVTRVVMRIGAISGVDVDALRFGFEACTPGSIAEGAEFEIESIPARAHCQDCATDFTVESGFIFQCPRCGAFSGDVRSGKELELSRLEFSTDSAPSSEHVR
ncbi:MAG: hydrogenase maturation nickel metallochaperone HypA [Candidatus Didemnitutus sp.]|nr:hydrogenase maturation nickel metallochaperone HypA [Candidatus Didemnitutus sp.]